MIGRIGWFKDPLLHFFLAGALLFVAYSALHRGSKEAPRIVRLTAQEVNWLKETWNLRWQRPPTEEGLRDLVANYLQETLLAREAMEMGLDENDTVIRRRLAQKMDFFIVDAARLVEPDDATLRRYYDAHRAQYSAPSRVSFSQRFFGNEAAARQGLQKLSARADADIGEPSLFEDGYIAVSAQDVASIFGSDFASRLKGLSLGHWQGPIPSAYGFHLVFLHKRQIAEDRPYEAVRSKVLSDWRLEQETVAKARFFDKLLEKYTIETNEDIKKLLPTRKRLTP